MATKVRVDANHRYGCPSCDYVSHNLSTVRKHARRAHSQRVTVKTALTDEERRARQRQYERDHRQRKKGRVDGQLKNNPPTSSKTQRLSNVAAGRPVFTPSDADSRGVYGARRPIVTSEKSKIEGAGIGLFALVDLQPDDIVTRVDGVIVDDEPEDPTYTIEIPSRGKKKYLKCIDVPKKDRGLGSFVNREERRLGTRKNCSIVCHGKKLYIEITKNVAAGMELYTTYGRGYRIPK